MPNIWPEKGVRELFYLWPSSGKHYVGNVLKQSFLCDMQPVEYPQCLQNRNFCWIFLNFGMRRVVIRAEVYCPHLWAQLVLNRGTVYYGYYHVKSVSAASILSSTFILLLIVVEVAPPSAASAPILRNYLLDFCFFILNKYMESQFGVMLLTPQEQCLHCPWAVSNMTRTHLITLTPNFIKRFREASEAALVM